MRREGRRLRCLLTLLSDRIRLHGMSTDVRKNKQKKVGEDER